jgi:hypothetical protein
MYHFATTYDTSALTVVLLTTLAPWNFHPCMFAVFIHRLHDSPSWTSDHVTFGLCITADSFFDTTVT